MPDWKRMFFILAKAALMGHEEPAMDYNKNHDERGRFSAGGNTGKVDFDRGRKRKEIRLEKAEYARVMSELNTHLTKEERKQKRIQRAIGNHVYSIENNGFDNYRIIGKMKID